MSKRLLEKYVQVVRMDGINTNKDVTIGVNGAVADLSVSGDLTVGGSINFAATTFDDPVTFQDTVTFDNGAAATFNDSVTFTDFVTFTNNTLVTGTLSVNNIQTNLEDLGNITGAITETPLHQVYTGTVTGNATIALDESATRASATVTFVLTSAGGGETVDFTGAETISTGTLNMGAGAGDVFVISFVSDGTKWCEVSRTAAQS